MNNAKRKSRWISVADVRASQNLASVSVPRLMRYLFLPAAWPLTVVAMRAGLTPNLVTVIRGLIGVTAMFCIAQPSSLIFSAGIALLILSLIGDSVDGNICRLQDRASYFGKFLDGYVDIVIDLAFPLVLAIHLWRGGEADPSILVLGSIGTLALALVFVLLQRSSLFELILQQQTGKRGTEAAAVHDPGLQTFFSNSQVRKFLSALDAQGMNAVFDLRYLGLSLALISDGLIVYIYGLTVLYVAVLLVFGGNRMARAYWMLGVHRRSRSAL